ncbi:MAG: NAD-dependent deacylase [Candidatus Cloacimonetes bacterium]|nr:NAD-dependent deacylase [Candidatus Cloacimonadota bacterium]
MLSNLRIKNDDNVTILTGAGISAESRIRTFRDGNGLWNEHRVEDVATPEGFRKNPELVWKFYKARYKQLSEVEPNPGHYALVELEKKCNDDFCLITQNVDNLHKLAGSKNVIEMHGTLVNCYCSNCRSYYSMSEIDMELPIPLCEHCNGRLRPNIVWFNEIPYELDKIHDVLSKTSILIVVGTSGQVYPAAQFLYYVKRNGGYTIGVNLEFTHDSSVYNEFHKGKSGVILPELINQITQI